MKIVIIGGVAGGASTAARLRRLSEDVEIVMFERGRDISYANCGIPYHIGDVIKDRGELVLVSKKSFGKMFKTDVRILSEVIKINRDKKTITVKDLTNNNVYEEKYDKLVYSPGGYPIRPAIPGINDSRIFTLRNLEDMDQIKTFIAEEKPKHAVVVGAGFIGLEMAENLHHLGINVSIVELAGQVMNLLDYEMACAIHQHLKTQGINLYLNDAVKEFKKEGEKLAISLNSGRKIEAGMVLLNVGISPESKLAQEAGLSVGQKGGVVVDRLMQTSDKDIYALGDVIEINDIVCDCPAMIPLANSANKQGRIVADNILGAKKEYQGTPGTAIAKVFDFDVAITGSSEKKLKKKGIPCEKVYLNPSSHAGYYPSAFPMMVKVIYDPKSGRVLGGQIIGSEGVDKRIDILAVMAQNHDTVYTLSKLELAYAPPFSSAKDPVNLAGMIAINQIEKKSRVIYWDQVKDFQDRGALFIDVRPKLSFDLGSIKGAINIPLNQIRDNLDKIPKDKDIVVYCNQGKMSYFALSILKNLGYENVYSLSGGYKLYSLTIENQENTGVFSNVFVDKKDDLLSAPASKGKIFKLDASGLQCPGPIIKLAEAFKDKNDGDVLEITATDPGFKNDVGAWCERAGYSLLSVSSVEEGKIMARIQKGLQTNKQGKQGQNNFQGDIPNDKTLVVFSNDLDKAIASFIIANGAASMGRKVTMFFTFWGLNILRKAKGPSVKKGLLDKMFGLMMPKGSRKLKLSKMNMMGMGTAMIRYVMKNKNVDSLEALIESAKAQGIKLVACQMSMDVMGIKKEELLDGVEVAGVASYLSAAEQADTNLFV